MIKRVMSLTRTLIRNNFSLFGRKGKSVKLGAKILYAFLLVYLCGIAGYGSWWLINLLIPLHQESLFLGFILYANLGFVFIQALLSCATFFYFAKENEYLLPLPLDSKEILAAKTAVSVIYIYFTEIFMTFVPLLCYGFLTGQPFYYYLVLPFVLVLIPVLPACLASLLIVLLFSFINLTRYKSLFHVLSILLAISLSMGISFFINGSGQSSAMMSLLSQGKELLDAYRNIFPTITFAIDALRCSSFLLTLTSLTVLGLISILSFALFVAVADRPFYKGLISSTFGSANIVVGKISSRSFRSRGIARSYIAKEFKNLFRNSIYLTQIVLPALIMPFIIVIAMWFSMHNNSADMQIVIRMAERWLFSEEAALTIVMVMLGVLFFSSMYVYASITGISRDGNDAAFMKQIPIPFFKQIFYKSVPDLVFTLADYLVFILIFLMFIRYPLKYLFMAVLIGILYSFVHGILFLLIDLKKPKLNWLNEYEVVKNNFRIVYVILFVVLNFGTMGALYVLGVRNAYLFYALFVVFYTILSVGLALYVIKKDFRLADGIS